MDPSRFAIHPDVAKQHSLSVIVCAHKEGDEVRKTVASILDRGDEVGRLQVIVGDDGAPDGCCDGMPSGVEVVRMGRHAGRGVTANEAATHATGDVLLFPDAHMRVPAGALGNILATAHEYQAVTCAGVQGEEKTTGCQGWGAAFRFHRRGRLGVRFCQPEGGMTPGEAVRVEQPFGGFYAFPRAVFDRLGGWTDTAACWGYCEQPIGFMAWCLDVPILAVPDIISHKFRKVNPAGANEVDVWKNVAYSHWLAFRGRTYCAYWRPILEAHLGEIGLRELEQRFIDEETARLVKWTDERDAHADRTDARFFREMLKVEPFEEEGAVVGVKTASIILPTYNDGAEVFKTWQSVAVASTRDPQIVLVDDASTDGGVKRLRENGKELYPPNVRILKNPVRQGVTRSRLVGMSRADEAVLGFMDAHSRCQPGDPDRLTDAAYETGGFIVGAMRGMGEERVLADGTPRANWGSRWCIKPKWGLRGTYNVNKPAETLARCSMAMGSCYFVRRDVLKRMGGWPALPGKWAYSEQAMAIKALNLSIPILCHTGVLIDHLMKSGTIDVPQEDVILNAHFVHRAYFDEATYTDIWRPILMEMGDTPKLDELLKSDLLKAEIEFFASIRRYTDEQFFAHALGAHPEDLLQINPVTGRAVPNTQAGYIAYEARRSPGREWLADRKRMDVRHIPFLMRQVRALNWTPATLRVLDIGSRDGYSLECLQAQGFDKARVQGLEFSPWAAANARAHGRNVRTGDAHTALGEWTDGAFDVVTIIHCLEHCHTPSKVLAEAFRVLAPGGLLMVVVPIEPTGLSVKGDHCYAMRSEIEVQKLLEAAGFGLSPSMNQWERVGTEYSIATRKGGW